MMISEWGVHEDPDDPAYKPGFFSTAIDQLKGFPAIKGLVYWNAKAGPVVGVTRVDSSAATLQAFRTFAADPILNKPGDYYLD